VAQSALDHLRSSRNLDYLLDDDEPQAKRGFGKVLLLLVALALALGFGYLRWKQGGFDWLTGDAKKSAAAQAGDAPQTPADSAPATATPAPDAMPAATPAAATPNGNADAAVGSAPGATSSAAGAAVLPVSNPAASAPTTDSGSSGNGPAAPSAAAPANSSTATTPPPDAAPADARTPEVDAPPAKPERIAKPTPAKPVDPVASAEKYIYGRGVTQDCDRGLRQLKPAAEQSNPKAMISLGALYSTGVCTPRDLPTAYRWFALALRKQPENSSLQDDLQKLWSQMTPPERQLAIKLSQ
jgi:TPR repeat protein